MKQGWITASPIQTNGSFEVPQIEEGKSALILGTPSNASRCLVFENRVRVGFDECLAGAGLVVWDVAHIDEPTGPELKLVSANGSFDVVRRGTASDPFPGDKQVRSLEKNGISITGISDEGPMMRFNVSGFHGRAVRH
jgi:hypothetical protein